MQQNMNQNSLSETLIRAFKRYTTIQKQKMNCFEKSLLTCLLSFGQKNFCKLNELKQFTETKTSDIQNECDNMKQRLEIEGIKAYIDVKNIDSLPNEFDSKNWKNGLDKALEIQKEYHILDIDMLRELYEKTIKEATAIQNEDVILLLGPTGCGKSTTLHFLAGSVMEKVDANGFTHIKPTKNDTIPALIDKVTTSPYPISETNCLFSVQLEKSLFKNKEKGFIYLCDTPGFGDTNGCEVDIINSIGVIESIKKSKSVRPIIIISYRDAFTKRMGGLASLSHVLSKMIKNVSDCDGIFQFLFTHFPEDKKNELKMTVEHLLDQEKNKTKDSAFVFFLEELSENINDEFFIDPINSKRQPILKKIYKSNPLENPEDHFLCSFDETSKQKLNEQILRHQSVIDSCIDNQDYNLLRFKINELKFLSDTIGLVFIKKVFEECLLKMTNSINNKFNSAINDLCESVENSITIETKYVEAFKKQREYAKDVTDALKTEFGISGMITSEKFEQTLTKICKDLEEKIKERELDDSSLNMVLDKLRRLSTDFKEIEYKTDELKRKLKNCELSLDDSVKNLDFKKCADLLKALKKAQKSLSNHIDTESVNSVYSKVIKDLIKRLESLVEPIDNILNKCMIDEQNKNVLTTNLYLLQSCKENFIDFNDTEESFEMIYDSFIKKMLDFLEQVKKKITEDISDPNKIHDYTAIESWFQQVHTLFEICNDVKQQGASIFYSIVEIVFGFANELRRDIENDVAIVNISIEKDNSALYNRLYERIECFEKIKWFDKYRSGTYSDIQIKLKNFLLHEIKILKGDIEKICLDLENCQNLKKVNEKIEKMIEMEKLSKFIPEVEQEITKAINSNYKKTEDVISNIKAIIETEGEFKFDSINLKKIERSLEYLNFCKEVPFVAHKCYSSVCSNLEKYIGEYRKFIEREIEATLNKISSENEKSNQLNNAEKLQDFLSILLDIQHFPLFASLFDPNKASLLTKWKRRISDFHRELEDEIGKITIIHNRANALAKLEIVKCMSCLDDYLNNPNYSFTKLYRDAQKKLNDTADNVIISFNQALDTNDYDTAYKIMNDLKDSNDSVNNHLLSKCKSTIKLKITKLIENTKKLSNKYLHNSGDDNCNTQTLSDLVSHLNLMDEINIFEPSLLSENANSTDTVMFTSMTTNENISIKKEKIVKQIEDGIIDEMKQIDSYLEDDNFPKAARYLQLFKSRFEILDYHCSKDLHKKLTSTKNNFNEKLKDLKNKYEQKNIYDYRMDPPKELIEKLNTDSAYKETVKELEDIIQQKFKNEIDLLGSLKTTNLESINRRQSQAYNQSSENKPEEKTIQVDERDKLLKKLENISKSCLPKKLAGITNSDIQQFKNDIEQEKSKDIENTKNIINSENLNSIGEDYKKHLRLGNQENLTLLKHHINDSIIKFCNEVKTSINSNTAFTEFLENMKKLLEYINFCYTADININSKEPFELTKFLKSKLEHICETLENLFNLETENDCLLNSRNKKDIPSNSIYESFILLSNYVSIEKFQDANYHQVDLSCKDHTTIKRIYKIDNFTLRFEKLLLKIIDCTKEIDKLFKSYLKNFAFDLMSNILDKVQDWDDILKEVKKNKGFGIENIDGLDISYLSLLNDAIRKVEEFKSFFFNFELITDTTKTSDHQRTLYFNELKNKIDVSKKLKNLDKHIGRKINVKMFEIEITKMLQDKTNTMVGSINEALGKMEKGKIVESVCKDFYINFVHLKSAIEHIEFINENVKLMVKNQEQKIFEILNSLSKSVVLNSNAIDTVVEELIKMKVVADNIPLFKEKADKIVDESLKLYKQKSPPNAISKLATILNGHTIGKIIICEHSIFEGFALASFSKKVAPHGIDYVIQKLEGDEINKEKLRKKYDEFITMYDTLLKKHLQKHIDFEFVTSELNMLLGGSRDMGKWTATMHNLVPKVIAYIFAIWSLRKASLYFEAQGLDDADFYLRRPHPAQVIAIFRLLGIDLNGVDHNLCEVGTGEGKSVILAVTASMFALFGFDVYCVCYSKYLSERDYNDFKSIFETLGIGERVKYGTFNEICESLINEDGNVRSMIKSLILDSVIGIKNKKKERRKILLIDEVDVFLKSDFYGNLYKPVATLEQHVRPIVEYIWKNRNRLITIENIKKTNEYQGCYKYYKGWEFLIEEFTKNLLFDVSSFEKPEYVVKNDKIGYIEQDAVSFKTVYGYKTMFAYMYEHDKGNISGSSLNENISLQVRCGNFSYAEIPHRFKYLIGVTGTLKILTKPEKEIIESEYEINQKTYLPSVFGANQLTYFEQTDVHVENVHDYYNKINTEIASRLTGKTPGTKRAVLVFFESKASLIKFYNSEAFSAHRHLTKILSEEDNLTVKEKDLFVKDATRSGSISLITRSFGRGTDFVCRDDIVQANGGVHVIQTFLSEQYSEEVQIKGRTARQGEAGSYSMILLDEDLEKFTISLQDIQLNKSNIYQFIHKKRNEYFIKRYNSDTGFKEFIQTEHNKSIKLLDCLKSNDIEYIKRYLKETNKGAESVFHSKTLCLMDATGSMGELLIQAKNKVHEMFKDAIKILKEENLNSNCFQLQFAVYRDYDCGLREILEVSPWETKPDDLFSFMSKINAKGGGDYEEAIEIGLLYANLEFEKNKITQVILIGDAPAKQITQIKEYRKAYGGESSWSRKFGSPTEYKTEALKLNEKNVPVHTFYLHHGAKANFTEIAKLTNGNCNYLDVSSENSEQSLAFLVTRQILENIGESCGKGNELAEKYMQYFTRSHI